MLETSYFVKSSMLTFFLLLSLVQYYPWQFPWFISLNRDFDAEYLKWNGCQWESDDEISTESKWIFANKQWRWRHVCKSAINYWRNGSPILCVVEYTVCHWCIKLEAPQSKSSSSSDSDSKSKRCPNFRLNRIRTRLIVEFHQ